MRKNIFSIKAILLCAGTFLFSIANAQSDSTDVDLLSLLGEDEPTPVYANATFKTTRIVNLQSIEQTAGGVMDFRISHRFGEINTGLYNLFGLDESSMRLSLEYGVNDRFMVGLGRSNLNKEIDGFVKYKVFRQSTGKVNMPISVSWFSSMVARMINPEKDAPKPDFISRLYYTHQILIARKFNESLSVQITPTLVHRNLVADSTVKNDVFAGGIGARYKLNRRISINAEYIYVLPGQIADYYQNSFSIGFDIETGGHVFQLHFTNSKPMNEHSFITETTGNWAKGDIMFGFNISRVFTLGNRY